MSRRWREPPLEERFWEKVNKDGPVSRLGTQCWLWMAFVDKGGYARFRYDGKNGYAHRFSYRLAYGADPSSRQVHLDHRCHRRSCVRPDHLEPKTARRNLLNRSGVNKNSKTGVRGVHPKKGKFQAQVRIDGQLNHLGTFDTIEEAAAAVAAIERSIM